MRILIRLAAVLVVSQYLAFSVGGALAQEKMTLRVADFYPTSHKTPEYATRYWMSRVKELTAGQVEFEYYPAEQLGKAADLMSLAAAGVADVAGFGTSYVPEKMPHSAVAELPGGGASSCEGTLAYWKLARDGLLHEVDYAPNGVRLLFVVVNPPFQLYLTRDRLSSAKDVEGLKIRTTGAAQDATVRQLKAVPVRMAGPDIYEALSRGTLDGILFPLTSLPSYDLQKLVKVGTARENFGSGVLPYVMSDARWRRLPESVRAAMMTAGEEATRRACALIDKDGEPLHARLREQGVKLIEFSPEASAALREQLAVVGQAWAAALDRRGKSGTKVLKAFSAELGR